MPVNPISFANTPQAAGDIFLSSSTGLTEDTVRVVILDVMANDLGGNAKTLYALDDGTSTGGASPADLLVQDTARAESVSSDTSAAGARIWITSDGKVGYDTGSLSPSFQAQLQALNEGQVLTDSFTYAIRMGNGTLSWATATVQFAGRNDAPTVSGAVLANAVEDGHAVTLDALANARDVDSGTVLQVVNVPSTLPAGVTYDPATHSFSLDPTDAAYQHLAADQTQPVTVVYGVSDGTVTTQASVTFTVAGTNDAALIGAPTATGVTEDTGASGGLLSAAGTISVTDVDDGEAAFHTAVTPAAGALGTLALASDGSYTYSVANADVQFLGAGETQTDKFTITSVDGTSREVSFTITGVNDAAVIGAPTVAGVTEDTGVTTGNLGAAGTISISDADHGQSTFQTTVTGAAGNLGSLSLAADGSYTYSVANASTQFLGAGETQTDKFNVTSFDGTSKEVSFTITGVNDAAVIGDPTSAAVTEDTGVSGGSLNAAGTISISDADHGQSTFQTAVTGAAGNLGSLSLAADGSYTYAVANASVQFLGAGETQTDKFNVTSFDGTSKEVSFTITGVNDAAVIGDPTSAAVTEDAGVSGGSLNAAGTISISDADQNQSTFQTAVTGAAGNLGSMSLAADGSYTYSVANASTQFLGAGETQTDKFNVTSFDGTSKEVSFTITGANDAAVIGDPTAASVTEDAGVSGGQLRATGTISIADADQGQASFQATVTGAAGNLGSLVLATDGSYTYSVANAGVQSLGATDSRVDTFTVSAFDGTTKEVSFTIQGANDAAVIGDPTASTVTEDANVSGAGQLTASGTLAIGDADLNQASFQTTVSGAAGNLGSLSLAANGAYTYSVANSAVQFLGGTDTRVDQFTVTALDGTTKQVSFTIQGANDAAVIGTPTVSTVTEDVAVSSGGQLSATGTIPVSDADQGQAGFQTTVSAGSGALGSLTLNADGTYAYAVANAATQSLAGTDVHTDSFTVTALDGTTRIVSFTIQGANDVAVITGVTSATLTEDTGVVGGQLVTSGNQLNITDADAGQAAFQAQASTAGTYGTFTLSSAGVWTYSVSNSLADVQNLNTGQSLTDGFTATSADGSASTPVTVTIQGQTDAIVGTDKGDTYTFAASGSGSQAISDPGGNDVIAITGSTPLVTLDFERLGNDLQLQVNSQAVTVQGHFAGTGNAVETITFSAGQSYAGYDLAGTYTLFSGTGFAASNGSSNDVVAGTSVGQTLDGGGGASGRDLLFGNGGNDTLVGQNNNDLLVGGAGDDILQGGDGNDVLVGGAGSDVFVFNTALSASGNADHIADFDGNGDLVQLARAGVFSNLATPAGNALQAADFFSGAGAATASVGTAHIVYDTTTGNLYYDANGGASDQRTLFATIDPAGASGAVTAADFRVV